MTQTYKSHIHISRVWMSEVASLDK